MNKAVTEGIIFTPPPFEDGLDVWSRGDGTPGSPLYQIGPDVGIEPADQDFGGALRLLKTESRQRLRYTGRTPILPGCYLKITARVKAEQGNLPSVRIAGWPGTRNGNRVVGVIEQGPVVTLTTYGEVVEVSAIVGPGNRNGVDMVWGPSATYGHFGIDLEGPNNGIVLVDDLQIEDITSVFVQDMLGTVDVRDFGALGDGITDDSAAFIEADRAANGRTVRVSEGTYFLGNSVSFSSEVDFKGTVTMGAEEFLILSKNYDLATYIDAFGDEELAFKKAFQALLLSSTHEALDLNGRSIDITAPIDMQAAVPSRKDFATRRVIKNGRFNAVGSFAGDTVEVTSSARYDRSKPTRLVSVQNVANIPIGSLIVDGNGVGREVYVRDRNIARQELTLSAPLYGVDTIQTYTFRRFQYLLDFSGFTRLDKFGLANIEFQCNSRCSAIMLAPSGLVFRVEDCFISRPKDRGITSIGSGCQGMKISRCQFLSSEDSIDVESRRTIAFNANENDIKVRNCRATRFRHFGVVGGGNSLITGNHFFQGQGGNTVNRTRTAGIVIARPYCSAILSANYVDNCFIEWTNEHEPSPNRSGGFSFSALTVTDNVFLSGDVSSSFGYIVVKPYGSGHFLNGVTITGNRFRSIQGNVERVDRVDTSFANLDYSRFKDLTFFGNSYHAVNKQVSNPARLHHRQSSNARTWSIDMSDELPFGAPVADVDSVTAVSRIQNSSNADNFSRPYAIPGLGGQSRSVNVTWSEAVRGEVVVICRVDNAP